MKTGLAVSSHGSHFATFKGASRLLRSMPAPAPAAILAAGLFLATVLEVLPPLGRFIPGQLLVGLGVAVAVGVGGFTPWLLVAVVLGTFTGDALNFARAKHHPRFLMGGRGGWWLPGRDVDRLETSLRRRPVQTFLLRRFYTKDRALLPLAAGGWGMSWRTFLVCASVACLVWSLAWAAAGAAMALAMMHLPPAVGIAMLLGFLLVATRPLESGTPGAG